MMIYGLSTLGIFRKARTGSASKGKEVSFRDFRADPLSEAELADFIAEFGDRLVDRKSND